MTPQEKRKMALAKLHQVVEWLQECVEGHYETIDGFGGADFGIRVPMNDGTHRLITITGTISKNTFEDGDDFPWIELQKAKKEWYELRERKRKEKSYS